MLRACVLEFP
jgi:hypothetical protein